MHTTIIPHKLIAYIPENKWDCVDRLLPKGYTRIKAEGYWQGEREDISILVIYGRGNEIKKLREEIALHLLASGEQAVLFECDGQVRLVERNK